MGDAPLTMRAVPICACGKSAPDVGTGALGPWTPAGGLPGVDDGNSEFCFRTDCLSAHEPGSLRGHLLARAGVYHTHCD